MDIHHWGLRINDKDHLVFGGSDVIELAEIYGTPLHVVDTGVLRENYRRFLNGFHASYPKVKVFSSYKTNCIPGVLRVLHEAGCGAEVISPYELWLASKLSVPPSAIVYNGPNKSKEDLRGAIEQGVGVINVDSEAEADRLIEACEELRKPLKVGIRICPQKGWKAQFGLQPQADSIVRILKRLEGTGVICGFGLHAHIGSGIRSVNHYREAVKAICLLLREVKQELSRDLEYVDLGGGYGVPTVKFLTVQEVAFYKLFNIPPREPKARDCPSLEDFGEVIGDSLRQGCASYGLKDPWLFLEPGRALTSSAQILLVTVREIKKRSNGRTFAMTDGGMQNISFPLSYEYHHCLLAQRARAPSRGRYFVTGPLCSTEDILYRNWKLPELKEGDVLAIMDAGAYFTSFANNFSYPRPAVVMVSEGSHTLSRERESFEHMSAMDKL